ncbi:hypothetical protein [Chitinilyticum aquatile]|uniref:hypothetical protein n=1 Tax=Chitinilyticum aquatile TaxID=362520 RepID=UPI00041AEDEC|nr:hypothetical protein [Chitinilyticum aquatile]
MQRIWLNAGFLSYHPDRSRGFREQNWGFGAQLDLDDEWALMGGQFLNSENQHSHYLAAAWQPLKLGSFDLGLAVGAMDGYPRMSDGDWFLAALPLLSWRGDHLAVNVTGTPKIRDKIDAMIAIQLMWRVW